MPSRVKDKPYRESTASWKKSGRRVKRMIPLYDTLHSRRFPIVNWLLIALNGLVFLYEIRLSPAGLDELTRTWGLVPAQLMAHPAIVWVTIFTAMFLHGGWFHILSNMWVLFIFGDNIEDRLG